MKAAGTSVKLYFMLGLPTETEEDMKGIAHLAEKIAETYYDTVPKEQAQWKGTDRMSAPPSLCQSHLPHSSGLQCIQNRILWTRPKWLKDEIRAQLNQREY